MDDLNLVSFQLVQWIMLCGIHGSTDIIPTGYSYPAYFGTTISVGKFPKSSES